jgi:hypothetical protein
MIQIVKLISLSSLLILFSSCCTQKELVQADSLNCQGIVHLSENGCPFYVEITSSTQDGISVGGKIYPVELKDNYKKKGLKLKFNATVSRAPSPIDCAVDGVAILTDIVVVP